MSINKRFSALILGRLKDGGAEDRLSKTQYGFRKGYGTEDAIFIARRKIELAWAHRDGHLLVLALDWAKAFDSIDPEGMLAALRRFGLPEHLISVIAAIYSDRCFHVKDCGHISEKRAQHSGISQGCPLSPFLFVMLMTVVMVDVAAKLPDEDQAALAQGSLAELLYADDTLLLSVSASTLERFLAAVSEAGATYGLELHWGKLQLLRIRSESPVRRPDGSCIDSKEDISYLGTSLHGDGRVERELARRLGVAHADFRSLVRLWGHPSVSRSR